MQGTSSLFITDPLESLNPKKDTTILWMQEVFTMGGQILQCETKDLIYEEQQTFLTKNTQSWGMFSPVGINDFVHL